MKRAVATMGVAAAAVVVAVVASRGPISPRMCTRSAGDGGVCLRVLSDGTPRRHQHGGEVMPVAESRGQCAEPFPCPGVHP